MSIPVIELEGSSYEQGLWHGRELKDRIEHNIGVYFDYFVKDCKLSHEEVLLRAEKYMKALESTSPDFFEGMRGIAEGSGFDINTIAALNVRFELIYFQFMVNAMTDACTSFAVSPTVSANGHLLMGQNWDWIPEVKGAVIHTKEPDGLETLSFTEAGIFGGKIGFNSEGLGLTVNGLNTTEDDWSRLKKPFHARCSEILRSRDLESAVKVVTDEERSCSTNYLIAQLPDKAADIESAPKKIRELGWEYDFIVHTNHFLDPKALDVVEPPSRRHKYSLSRRARLLELLLSKHPISIDHLKDFLRDHERHPNSICRHFDPEGADDERLWTVASMIMDLDDRVLYFSEGQPCEVTYQQISME
ncbi:MAG: peptidase C45 [Thermoplasmata archaeon]|nr:peptidase C45 [Thermoplasmata archaeon]